MVISRRHFAEGITTRSRITTEMMGACLSVSDGYSTESDDLDAEFGLTNAIAFGSTIDAPPIYCGGYLVAHCADGKLYAHKNSVNSGRECPTPVGQMVAIGQRVIVPTKTGMYAYEPQYNAIRLLSVKAPYDYSPTEKPVVTWTDAQSTSLWAWNSESDWTMTGAVATVSGTRASLAISPSAAPDQVIASVASTASLANKSWLLIDVAIDNDPQLYSAAGAFVNDASMQPSGYVLELWDSSGVVGSFRIPRMQKSGRAHRFAINIGNIDATLAAVKIRTDTFWINTPGATISFWCGSYDQQWANGGAWVLPAPVWQDSPMYDVLANGSANASVAGTSNLIEDSSFTLNPATNPSSGWVMGTKVSWDQAIGRSAGGAIRLHSYEDGSPSAGIWTKEPIDVIAGQWCTLSFFAAQIWHKNLITHGHKPVDIVVEIIVSANNGGSVTQRYWYVDGYWRSEAQTNAPIVSHTEKEGVWVPYRFSFQVPVLAGDITLSVKFKRKNYSIDRNIAIDDVVLTQSNLRQQGTTVLLQTMSEGGEDRDPAPHMVEYAYAHCTRDTLGPKFNYEYSNTSNFTAPVVADPWSKPSISIAPPNGPGGIASANVDPLSGGAGYTVGQQIVVPSGTGGVLEVTGVSSGAVTALSVLFAGDGYSGMTFTDEGGAVITITSNGNTVVDDYATYTINGEVTPYLVGYLIYLRKTDGLGVTTAPTLESFISSDGRTGSISDLFPTIPYTYNDYASPAKHLMVADGRLYAAHLDYSAGMWIRPAYIEVSAYRRPYSFATTNGVDSLPTDGTELGDFTVTGNEITALAMRNATKLVFLDNEYFEMEGDSVSQGWRFGRRGSIGCKTFTPADCNSTLVWCDGRNFWGLTLDGAASISRERISPELINWDTHYNAIAFGDRYMMCCEYAGTRCILILDTVRMAWRIFTAIPSASRYICSDGNTVRIAAGSNVWQLSRTPATLTRTIKTSPLIVAPDGYDAHVNRLSIDVDTTATVSLNVSVSAIGIKNSTTSVHTLTFTTGECRRWVGLDVNAHSVVVTITSNTNVSHKIVSIALDVSDVPNSR